MRREEDEEFWLEISDREEILEYARREERRKRPEGLKEKKPIRKKKREERSERYE